ncbi:uncharacterized protein LOC119322323 isoform X1 [Triticum dicoccoides]|uniref:uncharacterized protein LOC119322323 isoform X1 n=1 Tax=Triticum dicoccoides TaxID=85692 RepID=UPI001891A769|nr:uncharacterized protein LOC119322323 isoform X1 [Triticum dicoccoides]
MDPARSVGGHRSRSIRRRANVSLMWMVSDIAERNRDMPFMLDDGSGNIDFIRCRDDGFCTIVFPKMHVHGIAISRTNGNEDCAFLFKITARWYIILASDLGVFELLPSAIVQSQNFIVITSIFYISWYCSHHTIAESLLERIINQWCAKLN